MVICAVEIFMIIHGSFIKNCFEKFNILTDRLLPQPTVSVARISAPSHPTLRSLAWACARFIIIRRLRRRREVTIYINFSKLSISLFISTTVFKLTTLSSVIGGKWKSRDDYCEKISVIFLWEKFGERVGIL